jgi:hypothetical protein
MRLTHPSRTPGAAIFILASLIAALMIPLSGLVAQTLSDKNFALDAVDRIWAEWSSPNDQALQYLAETYSKSVFYYGQPAPRKRVMDLKREFAARWPDRSYSIAPGSLEVSCPHPTDPCVVRGRVYWDARSQARDSRAVGLANFELGILRTGTSFLIVSESGQVIRNEKSQLSSGSDATPALMGTLLFPSPGTPRTAALQASQISKAVIFCFNDNQGRLTIQEMFDCSGVWVTSKALLRCSLGTQCPALPDTLIGRATLVATLGAENLTVTSTLELRPTDLPPMPAKAAIDKCKEFSSSKSEFSHCALAESTDESYAELQKCIRDSSGVAQGKCITSQLDDAELENMMTCLNGRQPAPDVVLQCWNDPTIVEKAEEIRKCGSMATNTAEAAACLSMGLPDNKKKVIECLAGPSGENAPEKCLHTISPEFARTTAVLDCLNQSDDLASQQVVICAGTQFPGDAGRIGGCLSKPDREAAARCLLGDSPELRAAEQLYRCASAGRDAASLIEIAPHI